MKKVDITEDTKLTKDKLLAINTEGQLYAANGKLREAEARVRYWRDEADRRSRALDTALAIKETQTPIVIRPRTPTKTSETVAISIMSDWHVEEMVDPSTINGLNAFNLEVADKRIRNLFQRTLQLINIWRNNTTIHTLVMPWLGDFINGYIHEEFLEDNELSPTQAVLWVQQRLMGGVNMMLKEGGFDKIIIPCVVGNHGRTTLKMRVATSYKNSFEWLMYHNIAMHYEQIGESRVEFNIPNSYHCYADIFGRTLRMHHGDAFSYREGVGGISVPVNKGILKWNKSKDAWLDIFGHWHQSKDDGSWICNGSLIGYNAYAMRIKAQYERPSQTLVFVEKDHGKTGTLPIWLD